MSGEIEVDLCTQHRSIVEFLSEICGIQSDRTARLAAMTVLTDLLKSMNGSLTTKQICLQSGILGYLDDVLDYGISVQYVDKLDIFHIKLALQIIWELSLAPVCCQEPLVNKDFLGKICSFIKLYDSPFQRYTHEGTKFLKSMCEGQHIVGQVGDDFIHMNTNVIPNDSNFFEKQCIAACPTQVRECKLFDTSHGDEDVNITDRFILENHGISKESLNRFPEESWKDILVTHVISGPYFWAQLGEKAILTSQKIQLLLASEELEHTEAHVGTYVAVKYEDTIFRCKILNDHGDYAIGMAIDYGMVIMVNEQMIFQMPSSTGILEYQPQAKLCCLSRVAPPLIDTGIQQLALGILVNLCRHKVAVGISLHSLKILEILKITLFCQIPALIFQSLSLMNNLLSNPRMGNKLPVDDIMKWIVEICNCISGLNVSTHMADKIAATCLSCLSTLLFKNRKKRNDFYMNHGLETALMFVGENSRPSIVYNRVVRLLKTYIITFNKSSNDNQGSNKSVGGNRKSPILKSINFEESSSSDEEYVNQADSPRIQVSDEEIFTGTLNAGKNTLAAEQYYIHKNDTGFRKSVTVELRENTTLQTISAESLAEVTCAMFNSGKGGTIYFGINCEGIVSGMRLSRDERDELRMGIDKMMNERLKPSVLHYQFTVTLLPVLKYNETGEMIKLKDIFVAEIYLESKPGMFYSCNKGKHCFYRFGDQTNLIHTRDIRHLIVLEEESVFKKEVLNLQYELAQLKLKTS